MNNTGFVTTGGELHRTKDFHVEKPVWVRISPEGVDCDQFAFHPLVKGVGFLDGGDGVWKCEDIYAEIPEWRKE